MQKSHDTCQNLVSVMAFFITKFGNVFDFLPNIVNSQGLTSFRRDSKLYIYVHEKGE